MQVAFRSGTHHVHREVALTMLVLPVVSVVVGQSLDPAASWLVLVGRWFVFSGVGARLTLAGVRQVLQPAFTAKGIFHMSGDEALPVVRELGAGNVATGVVGLLSLAAPGFTVPAAISAAIFYGAAGARRTLERDRSLNESVAMASDLFVFVVLALFVAGSAAVRAGNSPGADDSSGSRFSLAPAPRSAPP